MDADTVFKLKDTLDVLKYFASIGPHACDGINADLFLQGVIALSRDQAHDLQEAIQEIEEAQQNS